MTVADLVVQKLQNLPESRQREVLAFIDGLAESADHAIPRSSPYGMCADLATNLGFDEFQQVRREIWGSATDRELE